MFQELSIFSIIKKLLANKEDHGKTTVEATYDYHFNKLYSYYRLKSNLKAHLHGDASRD